MNLSNQTESHKILSLSLSLSIFIWYKSFYGLLQYGQLVSGLHAKGKGKKGSLVLYIYIYIYIKHSCQTQVEDYLDFLALESNLS